MTTLVVPYAIESYRLIIHEAEEGGYWGEVLELPGCVSQGETLDELRQNIREAMEAVLEAESQPSQIEISVAPTLDERDIVQFAMPYGEDVSWAGAPETWTATG